MCSGSVGDAGGSGEEAGGAGRRSGEREVGYSHFTLFSAKISHALLFTRSPPAVLFPLLRLACRDIGGSDPERMAAPRVAEYVQELFKDSPVQVARNIIL